MPGRILLALHIGFTAFAGVVVALIDFASGRRAR